MRQEYILFSFFFFAARRVYHDCKTFSTKKKKKKKRKNAVPFNWNLAPIASTIKRNRFARSVCPFNLRPASGSDLPDDDSREQ